MKYKQFGNTGIKLSVFGFGGAKFKNGKTNEENAELVLYAIERGVNHFDAGVGYTNSEEIFGLAANYCMPYCPKHIPIAEYMLFYNRKHIFGCPQEEFEKRLGFHKQWGTFAKREADAKDCAKCGACEKQCTQHIDIVGRLEEIAGIEARMS